ncbi:MAG TPA: Mrp/NBP35 family ATP-binding protein [Thermomicrobiales bacterium]|nr:Mrp/NBP35 family ATP-binding protein [Thermomicrobiales bacterium]
MSVPGFNAPERGAPLRRLSLPDVGRVVTVASGKGGVGKSTVAVNLALAMSRRGWRVGLLDADAHGPDVPLMLGVRRRDDVSGWEALLPVGRNLGLGDLAQHTLPPLERFGIRVMSLGLLVGEEQATLAQHASLVGWLVRNLLAMVDWGALDILLIDLPPGTGEPQATLLETVVLDGVLFVVGPQDLALLDTGRALRAFQTAGVPVIGAVENMSYLLCPACGERIQVFHRGSVPRAITSGEIPLLAEIPIDPAISEAGDTGRPVVVAAPDSNQARLFLDLAARVEARLGGR